MYELLAGVVPTLPEVQAADDRLEKGHLSGYGDGHNLSLSVCRPGLLAV